MNLGQAIKQIRKSKKISQKEFALRVGISRTSLVNIENHNGMPQKETFNKIANSLNLSKEYILFKSIEVEDVAKEKQELFKILSPVLTKIFELENELD